MSCKSPSHDMLARAKESARIQSFIIAKQIADAEAIEDEDRKNIAIEMVLRDTGRRVEWALHHRKEAEAALAAHYKRGCKGL